MELLDIFSDSQKALDELRRNKIFRRQNKERQQAEDLLDAMSKCRGKLKISLKSFERSIREQSKFIQEGLRDGKDVLLQEQTLWDAAIGYMLVSDANFALKSINTYDSVEHAYELLEEAVKIMTGRAKPKESLNLGKQRERDAYGYITSKAAIKRKEEMLDSFFNELKISGDIEACIEAYRNGQGNDTPKEDKDSVDEMLNRLPSSQNEGDSLEDDDSFYSMDVPRK